MRNPRLFGASLSAVALAAWGLARAAEPAKVEPADLPVALWADATAATIGQTGEWTNKVELADLNGDGLVDLLFANGGDYRSPGEPVPSRIFLNQGPGKPFREATEEIFGTEGMLVRAIKTADVNGDGHLDIFFAATYDTPSRLLLGRGAGRFEDVSATHIPREPRSFGDIEFGDVDFDGDLDMVLADWGPGNPMQNEGGRIRLWLNDGSGRFTDATEARMPDVRVKFSWDLEFADVDNDGDLDVMISSKLDAGSFLFENNGKGFFTDVTAGRMPQFTNNYEFEPMDLNGDGFVDTVTINDGGQIEGKRGMRKENVFLNDGKGGFIHATPTSLPDSENLGYDDNRVVYLDYDNDGDADVLLGSLSGPDRLLINDGKGVFRVATEVVEGPETKGTLCIALADLDGDNRLDLVMAQGEVKGHIAEKVFLAKNLAPDSAPPKVQWLVRDGARVRARVHDNKAPMRPFDFRSVALVAGGREFPMTWYGETLWTAALPEGATDYEICATDRAGNRACAQGR